MAGPAVVVVAGFITLWLAISSDDGLVSDDYYKQGLTVNQRLQRDHLAGDLGLHADVMKSGLGFGYFWLQMVMRNCRERSISSWLIQHGLVRISW